LMPTLAFGSRLKTHMTAYEHHKSKIDCAVRCSVIVYCKLFYPLLGYCIETVEQVKLAVFFANTNLFAGYQP